MAVPDPLYIYRMVHWQNVSYILQNGICCREHPDGDPNYINIGHLQLISDRHEYPIPFPGAGNLGDYVPFYFAGHTPMLYLIKNGFKGVEQRPQEDIVFLVSTFNKIKDEELEFLFTDRNAKMSLVKVYNNEQDFDKLPWDIIMNKYWSNDEENRARQDFKQAEFLIRNHVPVNCISAIVVKTEERKVYFDKLVSELQLQIGVYVDNNCKLFY